MSQEWNMMKIHKDLMKKILCLNKYKFIQCKIDKFNMVNSKVVWYPLVVHSKHSETKCLIDVNQKNKMSCVLYDKDVSSLMYLIVYTRLDIALAIGKVNRFMSNPDNVK